MDILSQTHSQSIFRVCENVWYVHEFLVDNKIYGSLIVNSRSLTPGEILAKHKKKFASTVCQELSFDDNHELICDLSPIKDLKGPVVLQLIQESDLPVTTYVSFGADELEQLINNQVTFCCDYMDQGLDEIMDLDGEYETHEEFIREALWIDDGSVNYCAGESPVVELADLNRVLKTNYTHIERCEDHNYDLHLEPSDQ
jgi:hypothetical protein